MKQSTCKGDKDPWQQCCPLNRTPLCQYKITTMVPLLKHTSVENKKKLRDCTSKEAPPEEWMQRPAKQLYATKFYSTISAGKKKKRKPVRNADTKPGPVVSHLGSTAVPNPGPETRQRESGGETSTYQIRDVHLKPD